MYDIKALYEAESVGDAIRLMQEHPEAQIIAGGSELNEAPPPAATEAATDRPFRKLRRLTFIPVSSFL